MFDHRSNHSVTECQVFLTRRCNSKCGSCNLPKSGKGIIELSSDAWKGVFRNLRRLGIKTVKVMGGEPTEALDFSALLDLFRHASDLGIRTALLSNSKWDIKWVDALCNSGLFGYFASVDTIIGRAADADAVLKSQLGYQMLRRLRGKLPLIAANVVMTNANLNDVVPLVRSLSGQGFWANICPVQGYLERPLYLSRPTSYAFRQANLDTMLRDQKSVQAVVDELIELQRSGTCIAVPESYLMGIPQWGLFGGTWECDKFVQLRIDSDGQVMLCNEFRGLDFSLVSTIESPDQWSRVFIDAWYAVRSRYKCNCYWSCFVQAQHNIEEGIPEFHFVDKYSAR